MVHPLFSGLTVITNADHAMSRHL